jgi:hypothetical protein
MKKYITPVSFTKISVLFIMLFSTLINAQTDLPVEPVDEPAAPIDGYVWVLAAIGLVYLFLRLRAFSRQEKSQS